MTEAQAKVIEAAKACVANAKWMRGEFAAGNLMAAGDMRYRDSVTQLIAEVDALAREEQASDVCECGHELDAHAKSNSGKLRCWHICKCTEYRPKQKGGE